MNKDEFFMNYAIKVAKSGIGRTGRNPSVGCVIVDKDGNILISSRTQDGGSPHAERHALSQLGEKAIGATMYVTLEPCVHHGKNPPCTDIITASHITRVVIGCIDPNPMVKDKSKNILEQNGIEVVTGVLENECKELLAGFYMNHNYERPRITVKTAYSADGFIATRSGDSKWITSDKMREYAHILRSKNDAVIVGINTVLKDDPNLDVRVPGLEKYTPIRIVMDSKLRIPLDCNLLKNAHKYEQPTFIVCNEDEATDDDARIRKFAAIPNIRIVPLANVHYLENLMKFFNHEDIHNILIEGGGKVAGSFFKKGLVDEWIKIQGNQIIGDDGIAGITDLDIENMEDTIKLNLIKQTNIDDNVINKFSVQKKTAIADIQAIETLNISNKEYYLQKIKEKQNKS